MQAKQVVAPLGIGFYNRKSTFSSQIVTWPPLGPKSSSKLPDTTRRVPRLLPDCFRGHPAAKVTLPRLHCPGYTSKVTLPSLRSQGYLAYVTQPRLHSQGYFAKVTQPRLRCLGYTAKITQPRLRCQDYAAKVTLPRLRSQGYVA